MNSRGLRFADELGVSELPEVRNVDAEPHTATHLQPLRGALRGPKSLALAEPQERHECEVVALPLGFGGARGLQSDA